MPLFFEAKEHGMMALSGEDLIPAWSRMQQKVEESGFRSYVATLFRSADRMANVSDPDDYRESEIFDGKGKDFYDPNFVMFITQMSVKALVAGEPPYYQVRVSFQYELNGQHTMEISGAEQTYKGILPTSFTVETEEVQKVRDGLIQAMLRPKVIGQKAEQ